MKISVVCFQKNRHAELEAAEGEYLKRLAARARVVVVAHTELEQRRATLGCSATWGAGYL